MSVSLCPTPWKDFFATEAAAREHILEFKQPSVKRKTLRAYLCDCGHWHITKKPLRVIA